MLYKIALFLVSTILVYMLLALTLQAMTGQVARSYQVLDENSVVTVAGASGIALADLARTYQPIIVKPLEPTPPLLEVAYEVIDQGDRYTINYFHTWEDEVHPNAIIHLLYRAYRASRYGVPVRDVEYTQIDVSKSGTVMKVRFENTPGSDYYVWNSIHLIDEYFIEKGGTYLRRLTETDGTVLEASEPVEIQWDHHRIVITPATWNHLTRLARPDEVMSGERLDAPLHYLTAEEYQSHKYARRSQGDYATREGPLFSTCGVFASALYALLAGLALSVLVRRNRPAGQSR